ncbi:MAG: hypothetical protein KGY68_04530 [Candidatus Thermoplasmatota archaeon]|nr:hypothetical protein [Candidatus Thermoplasmatota archaeon]
MKKAVITVDVELDRGGGIEGLKKLDELLEKYTGFTLLITPETLKKAPDIVKSWEDENEIGLHIHPAELGFDEDLFDIYSYEEQRKMFEESLNIFSKFLDSKITSFRPGRWRFHENIYPIMKEFRMTHSSSKYPRPGSDNEPHGVEDIIEHSPTIWTPEPLSDVVGKEKKQKKGFEDILEIPVSIHSVRKFGVVFNAALCNNVDYPLIYIASKSLSHLEYQMFTFHSFNLLDKKVEDRIKNFIGYLNRGREITELSKITV